MKNKKLHEDIDEAFRKFEELDNDPIMRIVDYNARTGDRIGAWYMGCRYVAAKREKDSFLKTVKQPFVSEEELR